MLYRTPLPAPQATDLFSDVTRLASTAPQREPELGDSGEETQTSAPRAGILDPLYNKTHRRTFGSSSVCLHLIFPSASALFLLVLCLLADLCLALVPYLPHLFLSHLLQGRTDFKVEEPRKGKDFNSYCLAAVLTFFIFPLISLSHFLSLTSTQPPKSSFKQGCPPCCVLSPQGKDMPEHIPSS